MAGGGGRSPFRGRTPEELARLVRQAEDRSSVAAFESELSGMFASLLGAYNSRDTELVRDRLDDAKQRLEGAIEGTIDQLFGGSVAKHTYVDGLSDIDSLVIINDTSLETGGPQRALDRMTSLLQRGLPGDPVASHGRMAVTLSYPDGMTIQLLPALRLADGHLRVPSSRRDAWSRIDPQGFRDALARRNEECGGKLVPTIKLAKAVNGTLPESLRLSGYHVESLAVAAFRGYNATKSTSVMLPTFFERAKDLVLEPIKDSTGQSVHVDDYLGPPNSDARLTVSHVLGRIAKRMRNATTVGSRAQWEAILDLEE